MNNTSPTSNLRNLAAQSSDDLRAKLHPAMTCEHAATAELLAYLGEYEARDLHLRDGFSSLYTFLTKGHGYSEGSAARRCAVARFCRAYPSVLALIACGSVSLSVAALVAAAFRKGELKDHQVSQVVVAVSRKSKSEAEIILANLGASITTAPRHKERVRAVAVKNSLVPLNDACANGGFQFDEAAQSFERECPQAAVLAIEHLAIEHLASERLASEHTATQQPKDHLPEEIMDRAKAAPLEFHVSLRLSAEVMDQLRRAQELMGADDLTSTIEKLASFYGARKDPLRAKANAKTKSRKDPRSKTPPVAVNDRPPSVSEPKPERSRYVAAPLRRLVYQKSRGQCSYVDPISGRRCEERRCLELDHIKPFALGGGHTQENLQMLCRAHNRMRAKDYFGKEFIQRAITSTGRR